MRNKYLIKLYVKAHYWWYHFKNKNRGLIIMDSEHDGVDYTKLGTWIGIMLGGGIFWYSIFFNGFFITITWLIVVSAIIALCFRMWDMRI